MAVDENAERGAGKKPLPPPEPGPRVLVVGGSDPSGAAGIQADLKTLTALGVFGASAITAITVQNQRGVTDVMPIPASLVTAQIDAALADAPCDVIKTGMLASIDVVNALADRAAQWGSSSRLVVDPVLKSTSGRALLPDDAREVLLERLVPAAALVTPNIPEATALTGVPISSLEHMSLAADHLLARGASAVLIKGGHLIEAEPELEVITDLLRTADGEQMLFERPRRKIMQPPKSKGPELGFRGTGCTLTSAIAAGIAEGHTLRSAVERARDYLDAAMGAASPFLNVRGLGHSLRPPTVA
jgi:hydroxymethylpyrimidine/phosphomethylpyrimidine kinase